VQRYKDKLKTEKGKLKITTVLRNINNQQTSKTYSRQQKPILSIETPIVESKTHDDGPSAFKFTLP
jgi:hypothetical protein